MSARADGASARELARLYCPPTQRAVFDALTGIEAEMRAGLDRRLDHTLAHARLAWWREECERLAQGAPLHPLTRELDARFGARGRTVLGGVRGFSDVATWDLAAATFESRRELDAYCQRWSAACIEPLAYFALGAGVLVRARGLGGSLCELELLNGLAPAARAGRVRLPLDELAQAHVAPEALQDAHWEAPLAALVRARHAAARDALAQTLAAFAPAEQAALRALLVWATLASVQSQRLAAALPRATFPGDHHAPLDGWRAWRAARQAAAGRFALPARGNGERP
jgi:phytoene synthase